MTERVQGVTQGADGAITIDLTEMDADQPHWLSPQTRKAHRPITKYSPDQPRDPAGSSTGGQWSDGGAGGGSLRDRKPEDYVSAGTALDFPATAALSATSAKAFLGAVAADPAVVEARRVLFKGTQTKALHTDEDGNYTAERLARHRQIVDQIMASGGGATRAGEQPTLVMFMGPPGSGKTSTLGPLIKKDEFTELNLDAIRRDIPEYQPQAAGLTQWEAEDIEKMLVKRLVAERHNTLLDWTGKTESKVLSVVEGFRRAGYRVEMYEVHVPTLEAGKRAYARFRFGRTADERRFVDPTYVMDVDSKPNNTYAAVRNSGNVDKWASYDNDVPFGKPGRLVDSGERKP